MTSRRSALVVDAFFRVAAVDDEPFREPKFYAFAAILQLHMAVSLSLWAWLRFDDWRRLTTIALQIACYWVMTRTHVRLGLLVTAAVVACEIATYPAGAGVGSISNHNVLEYLCLGTLLLVNPHNADERELALCTSRWFLVLVVFASGLQKVWHGTYFHGQFLAWAISTGGQWISLFRPFLDSGEVARLHGYSSMPLVFDRDQLLTPAPGPYRLTSWPLLFASNFVWMSEVVLPWLTFVKRTRRVATIMLIGVFAAFEAGARELFFGALVLNLLFLFSERDLSRWMLPIFVPIYTVAGLAQLGLLDVFIPR